MAVEIERRYFVDAAKFSRQKCIKVAHVWQGYLPGIARIRIIDRATAWLTIKGKKTGISNLEFEYEIPYDDGCEMQALAESVVEKLRYYCAYEQDSSLTWEVDIYVDRNDGLIIAELEVPSEEYSVVLPDWINRELSPEEYCALSNKNLSLNNLTRS